MFNFFRNAKSVAPVVKPESSLDVLCRTFGIEHFERLQIKESMTNATTIKMFWNQSQAGFVHSMVCNYHLSYNGAKILHALLSA